VVVIIIHSIRSRGHPCHQVLALAIVIDKKKQIYLNCRIWAMEKPLLRPLLPSYAWNRGPLIWPTATVSTNGDYPIRMSPGMVAMAARQIIGTSKDGSLPCHQFLSPNGGSSKVIIQPFPISNTTLSSAFGGGCPRWQPFNVAVVMSDLLDGSQTESWHGAAADVTRTTAMLVP
jgi:hypothetical protein